MLKRIFNILFIIFVLDSIVSLKILYSAVASQSQEKISLFYTEISIFGSASKYSNSSDSNSFVTAWGGSLGFTFAGTETIEFEYKNAYQKSRSTDLLVKTFYETYGANYLHALSNGRIQPFLKIGMGYVTSHYIVSSDNYPELNRKVERKPTISYTGGFGLKIYLTRTVSLKGSYTAQFIDAEESANGDSNTEFNYFLTGGLSFIF